MLGYLLAHREGFADPRQIAAVVLVRDMHEARTGDAFTFQREYVALDELRAAEDQVSGLGAAGEEILRMWVEVEHGDTEAGRIAKDAEIPEIAFTARELVVRGSTDAQEWIKSLRPRLHTPSAQLLLDLIDRSDPSEWWKRFKRQGQK